MAAQAPIAPITIARMEATSRRSPALVDHVHEKVSAGSPARATSGAILDSQADIVQSSVFRFRPKFDVPQPPRPCVREFVLAEGCDPWCVQALRMLADQASLDTVMVAQRHPRDGALSVRGGSRQGRGKGKGSGRGRAAAAVEALGVGDEDMRSAASAASKRRGERDVEASRCELLGGEKKR